MNIDKNGCCVQCIFSDKYGYDNYLCKRHAPIAVHDPNKNFGVHQEAFLPRWPIMKDTDWCGDFERDINLKEPT